MERWIWLGSSLLLTVLITQGSWWLWRWEKSRARLERFVQHPAFSPLLQLLRLFYAIGVPFAALLWGHDALIGLLLGLQPFSGPEPAAVWKAWAMDIGWAVALGLAAWGLLALGWRTVRRVDRGAISRCLTGPAWMLPFQAIGYEAHWSFYRNAFVVTLGAYWGSWAGLGLLALETLLNPWWRRGLREGEQLPALLVRAGLAVLSVVLYLQTTNLWLAIAVHWGVTAGLAAQDRPQNSAEITETSVISI